MNNKKVINILTVSSILLMILYLINFSIVWVEKWDFKILYGNKTTLLLGIVFAIVGFLIFGSNLKIRSPIKHILVVIFVCVGAILVNSISGLIIFGLIISNLVVLIILDWEKYKQLFGNLFIKK